ncbi:SDR family oxidoreductase [Luteimonas aquatica]|uniref:SDR family oxidoreductase n=1 Tax=Luteimonas aquatica TaxID=450364 RepID=UPI001F59F5C0|nr:SDR family oxidoreductase [Luteimonas aquatica]
MRDQRVVIVGGSSGMGLRVARSVVASGGQVVIGGRDPERLAQAAATLGERAQARRIDSSDKASIAAFFEGIGRFDHLFTPGSSQSSGRIDEIDDDTAESPFRSKFWGQYYAVKHALPHLAKTGSIVLMSGAYSQRPLAGSATYVACNSAIEGLARALAVELAPIRVNAISPGTIDTELWQTRLRHKREQAHAHYAAMAALGRVGTVDEAADAVLFLMRNTYTTGSTLFTDGGYTLR